MSCSESEEYEMPVCVRQGVDGIRPSSRRESYNESDHAFLVDDEEDEGHSADGVPIVETSANSDEPTRPAAAAGGAEMDTMFDSPDVASSAIETVPSTASESTTSGRGHYSRQAGKGHRMAWVPYVQQFVTAIFQSNLFLFKPAACANCCPNNGECFETMSARILKQCLSDSFGAACLNVDSEGTIIEPKKLVSNHEAVASWWDLAKQGRTLDEAGNCTGVCFKVNEKVVCMNAWAAAHCIPASTAQRIDQRLREGNATWKDETVCMRLCACASGINGTTPQNS